jgi:hypothetical protein
MLLHPGEVLATEDRLARPSSWVTSIPLPHDSLGVEVRGFDQVVTQLHQLTGPITPACDRYVQHLLVGTNPSVLNRHRRGATALKVSAFHTHLPNLPNQRSFPFHLRAPPGLQFSHNLTTNRAEFFKGPMAATWSSDHSTIYHNLQLRLAIANNLSLAIG